MSGFLSSLFGGSRRQPAGSSLTQAQARKVATAASFLVPGAKIFDVAPTGSMEPTLDGRSLVVAEPCRAEDLAVGDIVVRRMPVGDVVHRVIALAPVRTRGDANGAADSGAVAGADLLGRVCCIVYGSATE